MNRRMNQYFLIPYNVESTCISAERAVYSMINKIIKKQNRDNHMLRNGFAKKYGFSSNQAKAVVGSKINFREDLVDNGTIHHYDILKRLPIKTCIAILSCLIQETNDNREILEKTYNLQPIIIENALNIWSRIKYMLTTICLHPVNANICNRIDNSEEYANMLLLEGEKL